MVQQPVTPAAPGLYTTAADGSGQASVINQSGTVNAANTPAATGSVIAIYLTGAGQLTPAGTSGALGTANQAIAAPVTVTIGGASAEIKYAGAVPGSVQGLYQVNAVVPGGIRGSVPLLVTVGGASAQNNVTIYVD